MSVWTKIAWPIAASGARQFLERLARDQRDIRPRQRLHAVVGDVEEQVLEVHRVAWDMQRDDLPAAVAGDFLPIGEAAEQHGAVRRRVALADRIGVRFERLARVRYVEDGAAVFLAERHVASRAFAAATAMGCEARLSPANLAGAQIISQPSTAF